VGDDADGEWIRSIAPRLASDLSDLSGYISPAPTLHLHGDLHVGQVLRWRDGYAVTDFDGNPTVESGPDFVARDLAQLRTSVLHVAEIANRRTDGRHRAALLDWGRRTADDLLTAYRSGLAGHGFAHLLDERQLRPFEVEQECRELVYAARFLPRWRYAPMGVLRSWYG
jgi:maltokinase